MLQDSAGSKRKQLQTILDYMLREGGFAGSESEVMSPISTPILMTKAEVLQAQAQGEKIRYYNEFIGQYVNKFASARASELLPGMLRFIDNQLSFKARRYNRLIMRLRPEGAFFRTDETRPNHVVEVQQRIGGFGLVAVVLEGYEKSVQPYIPHQAVGSSTLLIDAIAAAAGQYQNGIVILVTSERFCHEQAALARRLSTRGLMVCLLPISSLHRIEGTVLNIEGLMDELPQVKNRLPPLPALKRVPINMILRRELTIEQLVELPGWEKLFPKYVEGRVGIQPELNILLDGKLQMAFGADPDVRGMLPLSLRNLFPASALIPDRWETPFLINGEMWTLNKILALPNHQRCFILKYAGHNLTYGYGGRGVHRLFLATHVEAKRHIETALQQVALGYPWMLQACDYTRYSAEYLDKTTGLPGCAENLHARNMMFYGVGSEGVKLIAGAVNLRPHWKATSSSDALVAPLYTDDELSAKYDVTGPHSTRRIVQSDRS